MLVGWPGDLPRGARLGAGRSAGLSNLPLAHSLFVFLQLNKAILFPTSRFRCTETLYTLLLNLAYSTDTTRSIIQPFEALALTLSVRSCSFSIHTTELRFNQPHLSCGHSATR